MENIHPREKIFISDIRYRADVHGQPCIVKTFLSSNGVGKDMNHKQKSLFSTVRSINIFYASDI